MGIKELWGMLELAKVETSLKEFRGKKLAVDFSVWFVECHSIQYPIRSIFSRVLDLLSHGITPVLVFDSPYAQELKQRKRGMSFHDATTPWEDILKTLGLPVIRAEGEAEKMCAQLNSAKIVDGIISNDGDTLAYGATTVLKGYKAKNPKICRYEMTTIIEKVGLDQKKMIAAAILIGCDHCEGGVKAVGKNVFLKLVDELKNRNITDLLDRIKSWKKNDELNSITKDEKALHEIKKTAHCSKCFHLGSITTHIKKGCELCHTNCDCTDKRKSTDTNLCPCHYHLMKRKVEPFLTELKVCESAVSDGRFFQKLDRVISEYMSEDASVCDDITSTMSIPNIPAFLALADELEFDKDSIKRLFPALVKMTLYGHVADLKVTPVEILNKKCRKDKEQCYLVKFQLFEFDKVTPEEDNGYDICVLQSVFDAKFPHMKPDEEPKKEAKGQKQAQELPLKGSKRDNQRKLTDVFPIKKKKGIDVE